MTTAKKRNRRTATKLSRNDEWRRFKERLGLLLNDLPAEVSSSTGFAVFLGLPPTVRRKVNGWLVGEQWPSAEGLRLIARKTRVSLDWLLIGVDQAGNPSDRPIYAGDMTAQTSMPQALGEWARRVVRAHVTGGHLRFRSVAGRAPSTESVLELLETWSPNTKRLLGEAELMAIANARAFLALKAWEAELGERFSVTLEALDRAAPHLKRRDRDSLLHSIDELALTVRDYHIDARGHRYESEWHSREEEWHGRNSKRLAQQEKQLRALQQQEQQRWAAMLYPALQPSEAVRRLRGSGRSAKRASK